MQEFVPYESEEVTEEQMQLEEMGLRNLEATLLAKQDYPTPEARVQALQMFYGLAERLRAIHHILRMRRQGLLN